MADHGEAGDGAQRRDESLDSAFELGGGFVVDDGITRDADGVVVMVAGVGLGKLEAVGGE